VPDHEQEADDATALAVVTWRNRMSPLRILGIVLLVAGIVALYFGWQASESIVEQAHETLTGRFTDDTMWYFIGGGAAAVAGLLLSVFGGRSH